MLQLILLALVVAVIAGALGMRRLQGTALRVAGVLIAAAVAVGLLVVLAIVALT